MTSSAPGGAPAAAPQRLCASSELEKNGKAIVLAAGQFAGLTAPNPELSYFSCM